MDKYWPFHLQKEIISFTLIKSDAPSKEDLRKLNKVIIYREKKVSVTSKRWWRTQGLAIFKAVINWDLKGQRGKDATGTQKKKYCSKGRVNFHIGYVIIKKEHSDCKNYCQQGKVEKEILVALPSPSSFSCQSFHKQNTIKSREKWTQNDVILEV